jgi:hypothetical protein
MHAARPKCLFADCSGALVVTRGTQLTFAVKVPKLAKTDLAAEQ